MARTSTQVDLAIVQKISSNFSNADVSDGSVIKDIVADSVSPEFGNVYTEIENIQDFANFVGNASTLTTEQMDDIASNYNKTRLLATTSTGEVTFRTKTKPTSTITIGNIDGSGGVSVLTKTLDDGSILGFETTATVYFTTSTAYNSSTGYYEVVAPIESTGTGTKYNISVGSITTLATSISGVNSVYNAISTSGATDDETNEELAARITVYFNGSSKVNAAGYKTIALDVSGVKSCNVVDPNSSESIRGAGTIDVYVYGTDYDTVSQESLTYTTGTNYYKLSKTPVYNISSVLALVSGVTTILTQNTDYELVNDTTSIYNSSVQSLDKVFLKDGGIKPDNGTAFLTTYTYNKLVETVQDEYETAENYILNGDVLVRQTDPAIIDIEMTILLYSGYRNQATYDKISTLVSDYITSQGVGSKISTSDIVFY
jgi:uncharacterized phage protein gp47/JayE